MAAMLRRFVRGRLIHRAHRFHRNGCSRRRLFERFLGLVRSHPCRFLSACARRCSQEFLCLLGNRRRCLRRDHLDYIVCDLRASTVAAQSRRRQTLGACARAEGHRNQCRCQCQEDSWSPHKREVCRKSQIMTSFFFDKNCRAPVAYGLRFSAPGVAHRGFNRPGDNRVQTAAPDRTSGHGRCKPGFDNEEQILLRPVPQ